MICMFATCVSNAHVSRHACLQLVLATHMCRDVYGMHMCRSMTCTCTCVATWTCGYKDPFLDTSEDGHLSCPRNCQAHRKLMVIFQLHSANGFGSSVTFMARSSQ